MKNDLDLVCCLKEYRLKSGYTQAELADLIDVSRNTISSIETGQYLPSICTLYKLCSVLECKITDLFYYPGEDNFEDW